MPDPKPEPTTAAAARAEELAKPRWHHQPDAPFERFCADCDALEAKADTLAAENAALREALRDFILAAEEVEAEYEHGTLPSGNIRRTAVKGLMGALVDHREVLQRLPAAAQEWLGRKEQEWEARRFDLQRAIDIADDEDRAQAVNDWLASPEAEQRLAAALHAEFHGTDAEQRFHINTLARDILAALRSQAASQPAEPFAALAALDTPQGAAE